MIAHPPPTQGKSWLGLTSVRVQNTTVFEPQTALHVTCIVLSIMDKSQHVQIAARLLTRTRKCERGLTRLMHDDLHWLQYSSASAVEAYCNSPYFVFGTELQLKVPRGSCRLLRSSWSPYHLRYARCHNLSVPRIRRSTFEITCIFCRRTTSLEFNAWSSAGYSC